MPIPEEILLSRVRNELELCRKSLRHQFVADQITSAPVTIEVTLRDAPGPEWKEGKVAERTTHKFKVVVTKDYPMQKPVVRWLTPIFHPNIMLPEDGGYVCTALLDRWTFRSNLQHFVGSIEVLLAQPNPDNPYDTDSCTRAASHFRIHPFRPGGRPAADDPGWLRVRPADGDRK